MFFNSYACTADIYVLYAMCNSCIHAELELGASLAEGGEAAAVIALYCNL